MAVSKIATIPLVAFIAVAMLVTRFRAMVLLVMKLFAVRTSTFTLRNASFALRTALMGRAMAPQAETPGAIAVAIAIGTAAAELAKLN